RGRGERHPRHRQRAVHLRQRLCGQPHRQPHQPQEDAEEPLLPTRCLHQRGHAHEGGRDHPHEGRGGHARPLCGDDGPGCGERHARDHVRQAGSAGHQRHTRRAGRLCPERAERDPARGADHRWGGGAGSGPPGAGKHGPCAKALHRIMIRIPPAFPDRGRASMKRSILLFAILTGVGVACKKGDKVPAYVEIPAITLNASDSQGGTSAKITDAWVYADEELIGVYEIPARIPILREGTSTLMVQPAVKRNGMYDDRVRYPFYTTWTGTVDMVPTNTATLQPVVQYVSQASFWIEGFEDAGTNVEVTAASDTTLLLPTAAEYPDLVAYGNGCGGFVLEQAHIYLLLYTMADFLSIGSAVYLELVHRY